VLKTPAHWQRLDFISDLHLKADASASFDAWQAFMQSTRADAVFILGDLFDVWVGDDVMLSAPDSASSPNFEANCAQVLRTAAQRLKIFLMHGNRDFLLGPAFAKAAGLTLLNDPSVLEFATGRSLLSHGDALCLADTDYMQFRSLVRSASWQQDFLQQPLARRLSMAHAMRSQSEDRKRGAVSFADLDPSATCQWLHRAQASTLIHGHTHQPDEYPLASGLRRIVLSDWDASANPARVEILRLSVACADPVGGCTLQRLTPQQAAA
jgi:UDP-2,3-diacylglucosamine hydrolase